ncbi:MAG: UvrD-helicase domain-containing protein [bacterium]|nr:UvrD-helicase domain-containing protein [bacterium]
MSQSLKDRIEAELTEKLNEVQRTAVLHDEGPLLIVAGAGSGKTRVITHRIAYLARIRDVFPWKIAAVTFTNKAAGEMRERLERLMGPMAQNVFVRTFHSLGLYVLTRHASLAGLKSGFTVLDQQAQATLLKRIMKERQIDPKQLSHQAIGSEINRARDAFQPPSEYRANHKDIYSEMIADVYEEYMARLRENNAVDFGDLQFETLRIFQRYPEVLADYRKLWRYFMIDEYQDTNRVQYLLGKMIAEDHRNIMVVGDDDQSIYSWRGADIGNILSFEEDYPEAKILRLEENYRSTPLILKAASSVIANNKARREKTLFTQSEGGQRIHQTAYDDETHEAMSIVSRVRSCKSKGIPYKDMAVFYRTNAQSRVFEKVLRENNINYVLVGALRFYERKEIKDLLAYLNVLVNPADDLSLERIINMPARGVGDTGLGRLQNLARMSGQSVLEALPRAGEIPNFRAAKKMQVLYEQFREWRALHESGELPSIIASQVLKDSGYLSMLQQDPSHEAPARIENLNEFVGALQQYEQEFGDREISAYDPGVDPDRFSIVESTGEIVDSSNASVASAAPQGVDSGGQDTLSGPNLADYIQRISLYTTDTEGAGTGGDDDAPEDFLYLMTLHNAKGLEFPVVFLSGLEEGYLPHSLSVEENNIEEERRLVYVGITRAREQLYLSYARRRWMFGSGQDRMASRFLDEIDPDVVDQEEVRSAYGGGGGGYGNGGAYGSRSGGAPRAGQGSGRLQWKSGPGAAKSAGAAAKFAGGDRVHHQKYGPGSIIATEQTPTGQKVTILFDGEDRERNFLTMYTPLTKI